MHLRLLILAGIQLSALLACGLSVSIVDGFEGGGGIASRRRDISFGSTDETYKAAKWLGVRFSKFSCQARQPLLL